MSLDELMDTARTGDPKAREALAAGLYDVLRPLFGRRFSADEAEDLVQSALVLIFRGIDRGEPPATRSFEQSVRFTARLLMFTARRSWARARDRRLAHRSITPSTSLSERFDRQERVASLVAAVDELETTDQRMISGWLLGSDWRELVETEGVARGTLRSRVHRALARLRNLMERRANSLRGPEQSTT